MLRLNALLMLVLLSACAGTLERAASTGAMPALRLAPAALARDLALQQQLTFQHGERRETIEALVEVDAKAVRLVMHAQGQVALRVDWDGQELTQTRAEWLPPVLSGERVLDDLQLVYWPVAAINARLPAGWHLVEAASNRRLLQDGEIVATVVFVSPTHVRLRQRRQGYVLDIHSVPVAR